MEALFEEDAVADEDLDEAAADDFQFGKITLGDVRLSLDVIYYGLHSYYVAFIHHSLRQRPHGCGWYAPTAPP